ncbi:unnamed protein product [Cuscuta epithymum]|uniref:Uncharacterized protein n=1 Tax=Cuscuta epithymum TaxID=186058 RepID=A0AAV0FL54_9ASTE|nr:unnamed protein product [Cuscuta epithymum]
MVILEESRLNQPNGSSSATILLYSDEVTPLGPSSSRGGLLLPTEAAVVDAHLPNMADVDDNLDVRTPFLIRVSGPSLRLGPTGCNRQLGPHRLVHTPVLYRMASLVHALPLVQASWDLAHNKRIWSLLPPTSSLPCRLPPSLLPENNGTWILWLHPTRLDYRSRLPRWEEVHPRSPPRLEVERPP